jgi:hypothetical protein
MFVHEELRFCHRIVGLQLNPEYSFDYLFSLIMYCNSRWNNGVSTIVQLFLIGQSPQVPFACIPNILPFYPFDRGDPLSTGYCFEGRGSCLLIKWQKWIKLAIDVQSDIGTVSTHEKSVFFRDQAKVTTF